MLVKESFDANIKFRFRDGKRLLFWADLWVGNSPLAAQFPRLYAYAKDRLAKACDYMILDGDCIQWGPIFIWDLVESEEVEFFSLLEALA